MKSGIVFLSVGVVLILFGIIGFAWYSSVYNMGNSSEQNIITLYKQSESKLSNYATSITEIAQVPEKYKNDLTEIIKTTMQGRYGENGMSDSAVMNFIHENNINLDSTVYINMQNAMIAGRKEFQISQERVMDACRAYKNELGSFLTGKILRSAGYPTIDLNEYCEIVSDNKTRDTFKTKTQEPVKIQ